MTKTSKAIIPTAIAGSIQPKLTPAEIKKKISILRSAWRIRESLLKLVVSNGNQLGATYRDMVINDPNIDPEKDITNEVILGKLLRSYTNITEWIVEQKVSEIKLAIAKSDIASKKDTPEKIAKRQEKELKTQLKKAKKELEVTLVNFKVPDDVDILLDFDDYLLVDSYIVLKNAETAQKNNLIKMLSGIPIYEEYLKHLSGVGEVIAAFLISEIDIHKCIYPSQLHSYFGLSPVQGFCNIRANWNKTNEEGKSIGVLSFSIRNENGKSIYIGKMKDWDHLQLKDNKIDKDDFYKYVTLVEDFEDQYKYRIIYESKKTDGPIDTNVTFDKDLIDLVGGVPKRLTKKNQAAAKKKAKEAEVAAEVETMGEEGLIGAIKPDFICAERGLGYAPSLQGKLKGAVVMPLVCHNSYYRDIRNGYKDRYAAMPQHAGKSKAHLQKMSEIKMLIVFLNQLYNKWRTLEGLPVAPDYAESKLGIIHGTGQNLPPPEAFDWGKPKKEKKDKVKDKD